MIIFRPRKSKFLYALLSDHRLPSRYFEARGKRSTIVTARQTRTAESRSALNRYAFLRKMPFIYHLRIYKLQKFALLASISSSQPFFLTTPLYIYSFLYIFVVTVKSHQNLQLDFRAMIIFRPRKNKFLPTLLTQLGILSRQYSKAGQLCNL